MFEMNPLSRRLCLVFAISVLPLSTQARFAGRQMFQASTPQTLHTTPLAACQAEVGRYNQAGNFKVTAVLGAYDASAPPQRNGNPYQCKVRFIDNTISNTFGGVMATYVCPPNASESSTRSDGEKLLGQTGCECNFGYEERYGRCVTASEANKAVSEDKNAGGGESCSLVGNPVNPATGGKFLSETDYAEGAGALRLEFTRSYNSVAAGSALLFPDGLANPDRAGSLGRGWRHNYERRLEVDSANNPESQPGPGSIVRVVRSNGAAVAFTWQADGSYKAEADVHHKLSATRSGSTITGHVFTDADDDSTETFAADGSLTQIKARGGWTQTLSYSTATTPSDIAPFPGLLTEVKDQTGRKLGLRYDTIGRVTQLLDPAGKSIRYAYSDESNLTDVTFQDGKARTYHYNEADKLEEQVHPESGERIAPDLPHALTGITDESRRRFAGYRYRADGRALGTEHAGEAQKFGFGYRDDGGVDITDPIGTTRSQDYKVVLGAKLPSAIDKACSADPGDAGRYRTTEYDPAGHLKYRVDFNGNRTDYTVNARGLEERRVEGLKADGSTRPEARTITTQWHSQWRVPSKRAEPLRLTTYDYDAAGNLKTLTQQATTDTTGALGLAAATTGTPRVWSYTYTAAGQVQTVDGPRTDVVDKTVHAYYDADDTQAPQRWRKGDLKSVTNALGHATQFTEYDLHGRLLAVTDPNGTVSRHAYDDRGRLNERRLGTMKESFAYDDRGLLEKHTRFDGVAITYAYDDAHRLIRTTDPAGDYVRRELNGFGQATLEESVSAGAVVHRLTRRFNPLARLEQITGGAGDYALLGYDGQGNLKSVRDKRSAAVAARITGYGYDGLNRRTSETRPAPKPGASTLLTQYGYDGADRLVRLTDPRGLATVYDYDGLGNLRKLTSPDSGAETRGYDAAGNMQTRLRADGVTTTWAWDALNRPLSATPSNGTTALAYGYDDVASGHPGRGRLTSLVKGNRIDYRYDAYGRLLSKSIDGSRFLQWRFGTSGTPSEAQLQTLLPRGQRQVRFTYGSVGEIDAIATVDQAPGMLAEGSSAARTVVKSVRYLPTVGGQYLLKSYTFGDGSAVPAQAYARSYDLSARVSTYATSGQTNRLTWDDAGRVGSVEVVGTATKSTFGYDEVDRLVSAQMPGITHGYDYDPGGNRTKWTQGATAWTYAIAPTSNRIQSTTGPVGGAVTTSANGNVQVFYIRDLTLPAVMQAAYVKLGHNADQPWDVASGVSVDDAPGRVLPPTEFLVGADQMRFGQSQWAVTYSEDDERRRWDEVSRGFRPSTGVGTAYCCMPTREYIWLKGTPVAVVAGQNPQLHSYIPLSGEVASSANLPKLYHVWTDHLNTPRQITDEAGKPRWSWSSYQADPFGADLPNEQPTAGLAPFKSTLRFAGQYWDFSSRLVHNGWREYNPQWGRYMEADPIGVAGGVNLYAYVGNNPLGFVDPQGLARCPVVERGPNGEPLRARTTISQGDLGTGTGTNASSRAYAQSMGNAGDDAGHMLGRNLGGSGGKDNIFAQAPNINRGQFAKFEGKVADYVRSNGRVDVDIRFNYTAGSTRPSEVVYRVYQNGSRVLRAVFEN